MTKLRLIPESVGAFEDKPRAVKPGPRPGLWARLALPRTQYGLLLYQDGRVYETTSWDDFEAYWDADDRIAGGYEASFDVDAWQVAVLRDAGYDLYDGEGVLYRSSIPYRSGVLYHGVP